MPVIDHLRFDRTTFSRLADAPKAGLRQDRVVYG